MKKVALLLAALAVSGCASKLWSRPGTDVQEARADLNRCRYEAEMAAAGYPGSGAMAAFKIGDLTHVCMESRGYEAHME